MTTANTASPTENTDLACTPLNPGWYFPQAAPSPLRVGATSSARNRFSAAWACSRSVPRDSVSTFFNAFARTPQASYTAGSTPRSSGRSISASSARLALNIGTNVPQA